MKTFYKILFSLRVMIVVLNLILAILLLKDIKSDSYDE